jgi:hypothetical protein
MKNIVFIILVILGLRFECQGQSVVAKIDTVNAIVIHKYIKANDYYCVAPTLLMLENDTLVFHTNSEYNKSLIKNYTFLTQSIGSPCDYSYDGLFDAVNQIFKHNLSFSEYNYLTNPHLSSTSLYNLANTDTNYYSIYNFYGIVIFYEGIKTEKQEVSESYSTKDCPCLNSYSGHINNKCFVVLKEVLELSPLSTEQEFKLNVCKSNVSKLDIIICE